MPLMGTPQFSAKDPTTHSLPLKLFPLKLQFANLSFLSFEAKEIPDNLTPEERVAASAVSIHVKVNATVDDNRAVVVTTLACRFLPEGKTPSENSPQEGASSSSPAVKDYYTLDVGITSGFSYDPTEITKAEVQEWCQKGSFFIALPYIRSIVAQITLESGFPVVKLPLLQVPTFKPTQAQDEQRTGDT